MPARRPAARRPALALLQLLVLTCGFAALTGCGASPAAGPAGSSSAAGGAAASKDAGGMKDVEIREDPVKTGIETGDAGLASKVRQRLAGDPKLGALQIEVDAESGRVTLWGHVPRAEDRAAAEEVARRTPGVGSILDHVKVDGAGSPPST